MNTPDWVLRIAEDFTTDWKKLCLEGSAPRYLQITKDCWANLTADYEGRVDQHFEIFVSDNEIHLDIDYEYFNLDENEFEQETYTQVLVGDREKSLTFFEELQSIMQANIDKINKANKQTQEESKLQKEQALERIEKASVEGWESIEMYFDSALGEGSWEQIKYFITEDL